MVAVGPNGEGEGSGWRGGTIEKRDVFVWHCRPKCFGTLLCSRLSEVN